MTKQEKNKLDELKNEYNIQEKKAKEKNKELNKLKKELLNSLEYQEMLDSKQYKKKNMEVIKEKRKSKELEMKFIRYREELMIKYK